MPDHRTTTGAPQLAAARPDDLLAFRLGRLILLLGHRPGPALAQTHGRGTHLPLRLLRGQPLLDFRARHRGARTLVLAGFRLAQPLLPVVGAALFIAPRAPAARPGDTDRIRTSVGDDPRPVGSSTRSQIPDADTRLILRSLRPGVPIECRTRDSCSEQAFRPRSPSSDPQWLRADELLIDLFEPVPVEAEAPS